ncbi:MAG: NlpC/P60 family protein, partial [Candidatus Solibacter sp.]|nr:NlpC/P60 family protein [Candidatus Solibacter sp.]
YFGGSEKKITHTGIYMGDGKFINATTHLTPMVRIDNLNDAYWSKLLVAARRLK